MSQTASSLLTHLSTQKAVVSAEGGHLRVEAPKGVLTDQLRQDLRHHKPEIVALLQQQEQVLDMSLEEFARCNLLVELRVPGCSQNIWWVPTSRAAEQLMQRGIGRGRIWTAEELQRVWDMGTLEQEHAQTLARIKARLGCELTALGLDDGGDES